MASKDLKLAINLLQTYGGRDKVMRIISYGSLLLSGLVKSPSKSKKLLTIFTELSGCRTILRLFDDLPMLGYSLSYGLGAQEKSLWLRVLSLANNLIDQLYFPLEHIAWAADKKLIDVSSSPWWILCIVAWGLSLSISILRSLMTLVSLRRSRKKLEQEIQMEDPCCSSGRQESSVVEGQQISRLKEAERAHLLEVLKYATDLCNAIHWMPVGFLWGGKLSDATVGFLGTISSVLYLQAVVRQTQARLAAQ
ncbi:peroxisomal membrane protein 11C-like [Acanthaster planci]|uniref:Peroxisomal membrane protein 11C-like n=1 Tax=Acanthaster planci TaxID=133434 RepID=A0A8B7XLP3_ACAPL|nr:peroxisomal membrane protein 11C-like [Acanthaster planci]